MSRTQWKGHRTTHYVYQSPVSTSRPILLSVVSVEWGRRGLETFVVKELSIRKWRSGSRDE